MPQISQISAFTVGMRGALLQKVDMHVKLENYAYSDVIQEVSGNSVGLSDFINNILRKV